MGALSYKCPNTSEDVTTSIETDETMLLKLRDLKLAVACPHCIGGHSVPANEMHFVESPPIACSESAKDQDDLINSATEIKVQAEIGAGEPLVEMPENQGAVSCKTGSKGKPVLDTGAKLSDLGVAESQSSQWQRLAALPEQQEAKIKHVEPRAAAAVNVTKAAKPPTKKHTRPSRIATANRRRV